MTRSPNQTKSSPVDTTPLIAGIEKFSILGYATFATRNKRPLHGGESWKIAHVDMFPVQESYPRGEYGIVLRAEDLVVDVDPRKFPDGRRVWSEFVRDFRVPEYIQKSRVVRTGSGGLHIFLKKPPEFKIRKGLPEYPGLDFLSEGCYCIGVGSKVPGTGDYTFINDPDRIMPAPAELLNAIRRAPADFTPLMEGFRDEDDNRNGFIEYLELTEPAVSGAGGDVHTFKVACRGRDFNLPPDVTTELMIKYFNPKCVPPWSETDLAFKVRNAYTYNTTPAGKRDPQVVLPALEERADDQLWMRQLDCTAKGAGHYRGTLKNAVLFLSNEKNIRGKFMLNEFTGKYEITDKMPWENRRLNSYREINDLEAGHIALYLAQIFHVEVPMPKLWEAIAIVCADRTRHPIRDWLEGLEWDGTPRLGSWLVDYCGVKDTPYARAVGEKTLMGAVARVYQPGIKFDTVLILEGEQGIGKSTTCSILGGRWYGDAQLDIQNQKDTIEYVHSHWIIEFSEMASVRKADINSLKNFITRQEDDARPAYARVRARFPRQSIFIGTVNPDSVGYLVDDANRRFWPVLCGDFDLPGLRRDRDQIFAEAVQGFKRGDALYLEKGLYAEALDEANKRRVRDPWDGIIEDYFTTGLGKEIYTTSAEDVYTTVIGGNFLHMNAGHCRRIAASLKSLGFMFRRTVEGNRYTRAVPAESKSEKGE